LCRTNFASEICFNMLDEPLILYVAFGQRSHSTWTLGFAIWVILRFSSLANNFKIKCPSLGTNWVTLQCPPPLQASRFATFFRYSLFFEKDNLQFGNFSTCTVVSLTAGCHYHHYNYCLHFHHCDLLPIEVCHNWHSHHLYHCCHPCCRWHFSLRLSLHCCCAVI
jgi:hypothetical protein